MQKQFSLFFVFFIVQISFAQYTYVPDDSFEQVLINLGRDDVLDDYVNTANLDSLYTLNIQYGDITDLTGIRDIVDLRVLLCRSNELTSLDLSGLSALEIIECNSNYISDLNISGCTSLSVLTCWGNELTSLDLTGFPNLTQLSCSGNPLTSLNVSGLTSLTSINCKNTSLTNLDVSGLSSLSFLDCSNSNISTLNTSGLDLLTHLACGHNSISNLEIESPLLEALWCHNNSLTSLDVSGSPNLLDLNCSNNSIANLNLGELPSLFKLHCHGNSIMEMDLTGLPSLNNLNCSGNDITSLDLSGSFQLSELDCGSNNLTNLDLSSSSLLTELECEFNLITSIDLSNLPLLTLFNCMGNEISSLDLSGSPLLTELNCSNNILSSLDLGASSLLTHLDCKDNFLTILDLTTNLNFENLSARDNDLRILNLKNGNNTLMGTNAIDVRNNPSLFCVQVDDVNYSSDNWSWIDDHTSFQTEPCGLSVYNLDYQNNNEIERKLSLDDLAVATDGSTATLFRYSGPNIDNIEVVVSEDLNNDIESYGSFEALETVNDSLNILYHHPKQFLEPNQQNKTYHIKFVNSETNEEIIKYPFKIVRPPVLMVHGIWSDGPKSFGDLFIRLLLENMYMPYQLQYGEYLNDIPNDDNEERFIWDGLEKSERISLENNLSSGKVDIIAHSNGGLLARQYIQSDNYNSDINKLITLNTPHSGSQLANLILEDNFSYVRELMSSYWNSPNNGVINDLKIDSNFIQELNGLTEQEFELIYNDIGTHSIYTNKTVGDLVGNLEASIFFWLKYEAIEYGDTILENVFDSANHDLAVSQVSQIGGCDNTSFVQNQAHSKSSSNLIIQNIIIDLLNQSASDSNYFSSNGFSPLQLDFSFSESLNRINSNQSDETISIINPIAGSEYNSGQQVIFQVEGSVGIENIVSTMGSKSIQLQNYVQEASSISNFSFTIPDEAIGRLNIVSAGFDSNGFADYDTSYIIVTTDAVIESIDIIQDIVFVTEDGNAPITIIGNYSDGVARDITSLAGIDYLFANQNATLTEVGVIGGVNQGEDLLTVTYMGQDASVPINIIQGESLNVHNQEINGFKLYPNPSNSIVYLSTQIPNGELIIYDVLGKEINKFETIPVQVDISKFENGVYLFNLTAENKVYQKKVIKY